MLRYDATVKELEETKVQLENLEGNLNGATERMEARLNTWLDCVNKVTDQLNTYFNNYMNALQYKGGVSMFIIVNEI